VSLSAEQRLSLLKIVSDVEEGRVPVPRADGAIGRFLAELGVLRKRVRDFLPYDGDFVRGEEVGAITLTPLAPLSERVGSDLLGEVGSTIAVTEELGGLVNVTLWAKAGSANRLRTVWLQTNRPVRLRGAFRWFVPRRVTPGTASVEDPPTTSNLWQARCVKFVADEFLAAPAALSYRWDTFFGPPDFRAFRVAALCRLSDKRSVVPNNEERLARPVVIPRSGAGLVGDTRAPPLALGMLVRDPWDTCWTVVDEKPIDANGVLAHMITWADHRRELLDLSPPPFQEVAAFQRILSRMGHSTCRDDALAKANLRREVAPATRQLAAWARGLA
jgi:hypothetical protein